MHNLRNIRAFLFASVILSIVFFLCFQEPYFLPFVRSFPPLRASGQKRPAPVSGHHSPSCCSRSLIAPDGVFRVLEKSGDPIPNIRIRFWVDGKGKPPVLALEARSNEDGFVFGAPEKTTRITLYEKGQIPWSRPWSIDDGDIILPSPVIRGTVKNYYPLFPPVLVGPPAVKTPGGVWRKKALPLPVLPDGRFQLRHLPEARFEIRLPIGFRFVQTNEARCTVQVPDLSVKLEIKRVKNLEVLPRAQEEFLRGKAIRLHLEADLVSGGRSIASVDGVEGKLFSLDLPVPLWNRLRIRVEELGNGRILAEQAILKLPEKKPLVLPLRYCREVAFIVDDQSLRPVHGAIVLSNNGERSVSDLDGRAKLLVAPGEKVLIVADSKQPIWVDLPKDLPDSVRVVMLPSSVLEVAVMPPIPSCRKTLRVVLVLPGSMSPAKIESAMGSILGEWPSPVSSSFDGKMSELSYELPPTQKLRWVGGIPAGFQMVNAKKIPIRIRLEDKFGTFLGMRNVILEPGKKQLVRFFLEGPPREIVGRVVSPDGKPVSGARLQLGDGMAEPIALGVDGKFHLGPFFGPVPCVRVSAEGYVDRELSGSGLQSESRIILERGRDVRIEVVDSGGRNISCRVILFSLKRTFGGQGLGKGIFRFHDVPRGILKACVLTGKTNREFEVPPGISRFVIKI